VFVVKSSSPARANIATIWRWRCLCLPPHVELQATCFPLTFTGHWSIHNHSQLNFTPTIALLHKHLFASRVHCLDPAITHCSLSHHATYILTAIVCASLTVCGSRSSSFLNHGVSATKSMAAITCTCQYLNPHLSNIQSSR
jgi:hypothetical protein